MKSVNGYERPLSESNYKKLETVVLRRRSRRVDGSGVLPGDGCCLTCLCGLAVAGVVGVEAALAAAVEGAVGCIHPGAGPV
jgi:hypothetical protein